MAAGSAAFTVTVILSVAVAPLLSVIVNLNTYTPCTKLYNPVVAELVLASVNVVGPLTFVHAYVVIVPSGSDPLPYSVAVLVGSVIVISAPASYRRLVAGCIHVTVTLSIAAAPLLSVTVSLNT